MKDLFRILFDIILRRRGPQDLPYSIPLLRGLLCAMVGLQLLVMFALRERIDAPERIVLSLLLTLALPWAVLRMRGMQARYVQTLSALVGTGILFSLALAPLLWLVHDLPLPTPDTPATPLQGVVSLFGLGLVAWKLAVDGHIWRHALGWPMVGGVLVAFGLFLLEVGIEQLLLPTATR